MSDTITCMEDLQKLVIGGETDWKQYGDVNHQVDGDLILFDYSQSAQFANRWNWFEQNSRGLILNRVTGEVVARPFEKFFNWFEHGRKANGHLVSVTAKMDGSLGILYRKNGQFHISTRGSMKSEQALWATEFLNANFDLTTLDDKWTLLFEIIYPSNRIVVDYNGMEDLVLLAARNRRNGAYSPYWHTSIIAAACGFTHVQPVAFNSVLDIIEATGTIDASQEGWVALFSDGTRWKFKGDRYRELHKLISGLSYKRIVKEMANNTIDEYMKYIPDEFADEAKQWITEVADKTNAIWMRVHNAYAAAPQDVDQKTFALWVTSQYKDIAPYLFALRKDENIMPLIYQREFKD